MQGLDQAPKDSNTIYLIVFIGIYVAEKVIVMASKVITVLRKNGNGKKKPEARCLQDPLFSQNWETHREVTRDIKKGVGRNEASMSTLKRESLLQTQELKNQTKAIEGQTAALQKANEHLAVIAKNGSHK